MLLDLLNSFLGRLNVKDEPREVQCRQDGANPVQITWTGWPRKGPGARLYSIYACNETNLIHCFPSVYSVIIPLHVSGLLVAHHQEVTMYMCNNWYVLC
jgi:hypothetical protein